MKRTFFKRKRIHIILWLCLTTFGAGAQEYLYEIGGMLGSSFYLGDANRSTLFRNLNPAAGFLFRYNLNFRVAFKADLAWARVSGSTEGLDNVFPNHAQASFQRNIIDMGAQAEFNFFPYSDKYKYENTKRIAPYIAGGLGFAAAPGNGGFFFSPYLSLGTGFKYKLKNRLNIGAEFTVRKLFGDGLDLSSDSDLLDDPYGIGSGFLKNRDWYSMLMISVTYDFGLRCKTCNNKELSVMY